MLITAQIDFHNRKKNTMEVNGATVLVINILKNIFRLWRNSYRFETKIRSKGD